MQTTYNEILEMEILEVGALMRSPCGYPKRADVKVAVLMRPSLSFSKIRREMRYFPETLQIFRFGLSSQSRCSIECDNE